MVSRIQDKNISGGTLFYGFIGNLKILIKNKHENLLKGPLTNEEIKHKKHIWIKELQEKQSSSDTFLKIKSSLKLLADENDILRCQSHLSETENLSISHGNPANIPHEENFIKLQSFTKYLRQTLVFIHYRKIQFFFCRRFLLVLKKTLISGEGLSTRQLFYEVLRFS